MEDVNEDIFHGFTIYSQSINLLGRRATNFRPSKLLELVIYIKALKVIVSFVSKVIIQVAISFVREIITISVDLFFSVTRMVL